MLKNYPCPKCKKVIEEAFASADGTVWCPFEQEWIERSDGAAQPSAERTACPVPHPQADFEFICDLCGKHVPARGCADLQMEK